MPANYSSRPAWVEISLDGIYSNVRQLKKLIGTQTEIMAVVKADGYGHGAVAVAATALKAGASSLAVAFVEEGISLRQAGLAVPILLLGYTDPDRYPDLLKYDLTPTVFSLEAATRFSAYAKARKRALKVHLKVDTGMGRVGLPAHGAVAAMMKIAQLPFLEIEGVFTHLAMAEDSSSPYTEEQLALFNVLLDECQEEGLVFKKIHAANSAAAINYPSSRYNLVRAGLVIYGHYPDASLAKNNPLSSLVPAATFKSRVVLVKEVPENSAISYDCTYTTSKKSLIATVPVGYADGYSRALSNKGQVLIRGCRVPVIGRVCMDHLMVDVTAVPGVRLNDEVVLYGRQGEEEVTVEEMAEITGTVNYELLCAIDKRVPRYYYWHNLLKGINDCFETVHFSSRFVNTFKD